jgi:hypothetical protein
VPFRNSCRITSFYAACLAPEGWVLKTANPCRALLAALALSGFLFATGCKSPHVEVTVENHTGEEVRLLEVDYPSASFGADKLAAGGSMHYSVALQGEGPIKVQYTALDPNQAQKQAQIAGPAVSEGQAGRLEIVLLPEGKAEFHPELHGGK